MEAALIFIVFGVGLILLVWFKASKDTRELNRKYASIAASLGAQFYDNSSSIGFPDIFNELELPLLKRGNRRDAWNIIEMETANGRMYHCYFNYYWRILPFGKSRWEHNTLVILETSLPNLNLPRVISTTLVGRILRRFSIKPSSSPLHGEILRLMESERSSRVEFCDNAILCYWPRFFSTPDETESNIEFLLRIHKTVLAHGATEIAKQQYDALEARHASVD